MSHRPIVHPRLALVALLVPLLALGACSKKTTAPKASGDPAPAPDTPRHAVDLFRWCWVHRDLETYTTLFTDDLVFQYQYRDTAGNLFADSLNRTTMIDSAAAIFSIASGIRLDYVAIDPAEADPRPGKDPGWHQTIAVKFNLLIRTALGSIVLSPVEDFFLTRGDSAAIPADLQARGFGPDPNRWYISRWEDNTYIPPPPAPAGARGSGEAADGAEPGRVWTTPWPPGKAFHAARDAASRARIGAGVGRPPGPLATERRLR